MAKVAGKDKHLADVVSMIEKGLERKYICEKMRKDAKVNPATTDRLIKEAKEVISKRNDEKEAIRRATMSKEYSEALNEQIISDIEIEAVLCKIITNGVKVEEFIKGEVVIRDVSPMEIISAAKTVYLKRGSNAPIKSSNTNPDGTPIDQPKVTMTDEQLAELKKSIESKK